MHKTALILNYDVLGGAERSGIEQAQFLDHCTIFYPKINDHTPITGEPFSMPQAFYKVSRSGKNQLIKGIFSYLKWFLFSKKIRLQNFDILWFNGLKVFILHLPILLISRKKKKVFFHLRDYIIKNKVLSFLFKIAIFLDLPLIILANSKDIESDFNEHYGELKIPTHTLYNPCKVSFPEKVDSLDSGKLVSASMLTSWKGIHSLVYFAHLYEKELLSIGINEVSIYGGEIYKTGHRSYKEQLDKLVKKLGVGIVKFYGNKPQAEIFNNCDILIHNSIEKEPFGRVILEAFGAKIPVLSTGLGGSAEIFPENIDHIFSPYDYAGLFEKIKMLKIDNAYRADSIDKCFKRYIKLSSHTENNINRIWSSFD